MHSPRLPLLGSLILLALVVVGVSVGAAAALPARAGAQAPDSFLVSPDQGGFAGFASSRPPGHLGLDATLWGGYALHTLEGKDLDLPGMLVRHRVDATAVVQVGLGSRVALAVRAPFVLYQAGAGQSDTALKPAGAGNPALDARVRVYGAGVRADGSVVDGAALALRAVVHAPIQGDSAERSFLRDQKTRLDLAATFDVELFGVLAGGAFSYRYRVDPFDTERSAHELRLDGGVRVPLPMIARALPGKLQESVLFEVGVGSFTEHFFARRATPVEGRLAYRVAVSDFTVSVGAGAAFNQAYGNPDLRVLFGFSYALRKFDQDADGVPDREDACVGEREDRDGFQDADGCADPDNDGDMIVDEDDRCPSVAAEWGQDEDEDGCTDG
ncbi:MAG TPA: hypothetical protein VFZ61_27190 [Polyangiales bacterium]